MNNPSARPKFSPSFVPIATIVTLFCTSFLLMLPVFGAAPAAPAAHLAHDHAEHEHLFVQPGDGPAVVDFGGPPGLPVAGLEQWQEAQGIHAAALDADVLGPKRAIVLRVYFNDYVNASRYTKVQVEGMFDELDTLWRNTSYNKINIDYQVSELFQLPDNRSEYVNDYPTGDLSESKFYKVIADAVDNAPAGLDWTNIDAVMVVMAETDPSQFHRGEAIKCNAKMGPGGPTKYVGCAIFSENPTETDRQVWGRWAHEIGHAFQEGGPAHPSNYNSEFELMDSNYPGQTGVFEKQSHTGFPGWMPPGKYAELSSLQDGQMVCLWAMEYDPTGKPNFQAVKAKITDSLYYMVSVRRRVLGDDLNGQFPNGIPDEGVLIERVSEGSDPWVVLKGPGGDRNKLWKEGQQYEDNADGIYIHITKKVDDDNYCVTIRYTKAANQPDVALHPWRSPPGNTWETTDIWIDSPVNGYDTYRYGKWNDLTGNLVPRGNGDDPAVGMVNRVYARVRNIGSQTATDVKVHFDVTDPLGVGIAGANGWALIGSVDKNQFPGLASIAPGAFVDVYVEWTPNITLTEEQIAEGIFAFHSCLRVRIDPVAGETALGNQDGELEQENISYFQAAPGPGGGEPVYNDVIRLRNDDLVNQKFFFLSYESDLPDAWELDINNGQLGVLLNPNEVRELPVVIKPQGPAVVGSVFGVDVQASSQRRLVNDLDPNDIHIEFKPLGGVRVEARVLERPTIECKATDHGEVLVQGKLSSPNWEKFYDEKNPPQVMIQGVDENRNFITRLPAWNAVPVNPDGSFEGFIYSRKPDIKEAICLFAGTDKLASASSGFVPVLGPNEPPQQCSELFSPTQIPAPGLINFDDLADATVIKDHYGPTHGVFFEDSAAARAVIVADGSGLPLSHSRPNTARNDAANPSTTPMLIRFDSLKTHVGLYMGNGAAGAAIPGTLSAYDSAGNLICQVTNHPVPFNVAEFIGIRDAAGRIASVTLDYGQFTNAEVIDDLFFAPHTPTGPTPTPTDTPQPPTPTATPVPPSPTPTNTPIVSNPVIAAPYLPVKELIAAPLFQPDLSIHGIEITQGVQCFDTSKGLANCPDNSLPVSTKKDTTARIHLKYSGVLLNGMNNVPVRLHIFANGVEYVANATGNARPTVNQAVKDSADVYFYVNFNSNVQVQFYAVVDPNNVISETNENNNRFPANGFITMNFQKRKDLKIVGQRLRYHPAGYTGTQHAGGWAVNGGASAWLNQLLPMRNNGINYKVASGYLDWTGTLATGDGQHDLIRYLNQSYVLQLIFNALFGVQGQYVGADHVYGWAPNGGYSGGHADMPVYPHAGGLGVVAIGTDRTSDGSNNTDSPGGGALIFGHELVHNYDVKHTNTADSCGSSDNTSPWPYATSSIQEFGFNPITGKIYDPATTHDIMSYCPAGASKQGWISPYTWNYMFNKLAPGGSVTTAAAEAETGVFRLTQAQKSLAVSATIYNPAAEHFNPAMPGKLGDLHLVETGVELALAGEGYAIQLRQGQEVLATHPFSVSFQSEYSVSTHGGHDGHDEEGPVHQADVVMIIPWVEGTGSIVLLHGDQVFDVRAVSANAPVVTITNPAAPADWPAGTVQTLTWEGGDADGDTLRYTVLFSADGGDEWQIMATELATSSLPIDVDAMAGTIDGRFRVIATDGVNTGAAESASVTLPNKTPVAQISEPVSGATFIPGQLVVLYGNAIDLEEGTLPEEALAWSSDRQGELGTGVSLPVNNLEPGEHVITLRAQDSQGATATATTTIFIGYQNYLPLINK